MSSIHTEILIYFLISIFIDKLYIQLNVSQSMLSDTESSTVSKEKNIKKQST